MKNYILQNVRQKSTPIDEEVTTWYNGWIEVRLFHRYFMKFMYHKYNGLALKYSIEFLYVINGNPNDMQTIYHSYQSNQRKHYITFLQLTFDQASQIVERASCLRLGGFHYL